MFYRVDSKNARLQKGILSLLIIQPNVDSCRAWSYIFGIDYQVSYLLGIAAITSYTALNSSRGFLCNLRFLFNLI